MLWETGKGADLQFVTPIRTKKKKSYIKCDTGERKGSYAKNSVTKYLNAGLSTFGKFFFDFLCVVGTKNHLKFIFSLHHSLDCFYFKHFNKDMHTKHEQMGKLLSLDSNFFYPLNLQSSPQPNFLNVMINRQAKFQGILEPKTVRNLKVLLL